MANYNDDHNESSTSGVGNLISTIKENRGLSKIRETQVAFMNSVFEDLADTCLRIQPGANPQDFSALSLILQAKRYSEVATELGMSQTEAVVSAERAITIVKKFLTRLARQKSAAVLVREDYKEQLKVEKERIKEEYEQTLEKEQSTIRNLSKELNYLRQNFFAVCTDIDARLNFLRSIPIYRLPVSYGLQSCLLNADFEKLGDVVKLSKQEVAKVNGITPYLRELDALVWRSGLDYLDKSV